MTTVPTPRLWTPDDPGGCMCGMRTQYNGRRIIREPAAAWAMKEFMHNDAGRVTLTERTRNLIRKVYKLGCQHVGDSRYAYPGTPDWHIWPLEQDQHPDGGELTHVFCELKVMRQNAQHDPSEAQVATMTQLGWLSPVYLARPCCLLSGCFDAMLCLHFGGEPRSKYAHGDPGAAFLAELSRDQSAAAAARAELLAPLSLPARPAPPADEPPGEPGLPLRNTPVTAYVVPMSGGDDGMRELEAWLRAVGFPPTSTRFPLRIIVGPEAVAVQVSPGRAVAGRTPPREWRWDATRIRFPVKLVDQLHIDVTLHPNFIAAAAAIEHAGNPAVVHP